LPALVIPQRQPLLQLHQVHRLQLHQQQALHHQAVLAVVEVITNGYIFKKIH
jgi:hypothetical protein